MVARQPGGDTFCPARAGFWGTSQVSALYARNRRISAHAIRQAFTATSHASDFGPRGGKSLVAIDINLPKAVNASSAIIVNKNQFTLNPPTPKAPTRPCSPAHHRQSVQGQECGLLQAFRGSCWFSCLQPREQCPSFRNCALGNHRVGRRSL